MEMYLDTRNLDKDFNFNIDIHNKIIEDQSAPIQERIRNENFAEELKDKSNYQGIDICFVIDSTGSMGPNIEGAKENLRTLIDDAKKSLIELQAQENSLRFAIVAYRDHTPQDITFATNIVISVHLMKPRNSLKDIKAAGGGIFMRLF